jgi:hypothetical protein
MKLAYLRFFLKICIHFFIHSVFLDKPNKKINIAIIQDCTPTSPSHILINKMYASQGQLEY